MFYTSKEPLEFYIYITKIRGTCVEMDNKAVGIWCREHKIRQAKFDITGSLNRDSAFVSFWLAEAWSKRWPTVNELERS